jgi:hypothetical protein
LSGAGPAGGGARAYGGRSVVLAGAVRTGIGRVGGALAGVHVGDLGAVAARGALALPRSPRSQAKWQKNIDTARASLHGPEFDTAWADGSAWTLDKAISEVLASTATPAVAA